MNEYSAYVGLDIHRDAIAMGGSPAGTRGVDVSRRDQESAQAAAASYWQPEPEWRSDEWSSREQCHSRFVY